LPGPAHARFVTNLMALPHDARSLIVRAFFDRGRPHPLQRPGQRVTSLSEPLEPFLARAAATPFRSYWQVATGSAERRRS
jgi:hypothetical protein